VGIDGRCVLHLAKLTLRLRLSAQADRELAIPAHQPRHFNLAAAKPKLRLRALKCMYRTRLCTDTYLFGRLVVDCIGRLVVDCIGRWQAVKQAGRGFAILTRRKDKQLSTYASRIQSPQFGNDLTLNPPLFIKSRLTTTTTRREAGREL
jgi:hypothetical protein